MNTRRAAVVGVSFVLVLGILGLGVSVIDLDGDGASISRELGKGTDPLKNDTDTDGLQDGKELGMGTDPKIKDTDLEGLNDSEELAQGTDPMNADTDNDGVDDTKEISIGTDAKSRDTDKDGLNDSFELSLNSNPKQMDSDGDGLSDGQEVGARTDFNQEDTDSDGVDDREEVERRKTNPNERDTDGDGLGDGEELRIGTGPTNSDTDMDGLNDGRETELGTEPARNDSDEDGLGDGRETEIGADPRKVDTDGDNLLDGWEVEDETDRGASLENSNPLRLDLYVQINYGESATKLSEEEIDDIHKHWSRMPVENPDGSEGVSIHIDDESPRGGYLGKDPLFTEGSLPFFKSGYYFGDSLALERTGVYHQVLLVEFTNTTSFVGFGEAPGKFSVVHYRHDDRSSTITHELLHNVMGTLRPENRCGGDELHTCEGWLAPTHDEKKLTPGLIKELEEERFEE